MKMNKNILVKSFMDNTCDSIFIQALKMNNDIFMDELPDIVESHNFSGRFERKMRHLIRANHTFNGKRWLEICTRYVTEAVAVIICILIVNTISIQALHINLWEVVVDSTGDMINIRFRDNKESASEKQEVAKNKESESIHLKIGSIPEGYSQQEFYSTDELVVQILQSDYGTITYTESPVTKTADINIAKGKSETEIIGMREVTFVSGENNITAFFTDVKYYHIVEIQGQDADKKTAIEIVKNLEEQ